jgi:hypothetical protein
LEGGKLRDDLLDREILYNSGDGRRLSGRYSGVAFRRSQEARGDGCVRRRRELRHVACVGYSRDRVKLLNSRKKPDSRQSPSDRTWVLLILPVTNSVVSVLWTRESSAAGFCGIECV